MSSIGEERKLSIASTASTGSAHSQAFADRLVAIADAYDSGDADAIFTAQQALTCTIESEKKVNRSKAEVEEVTAGMEKVAVKDKREKAIEALRKQLEDTTEVSDVGEGTIEGAEMVMYDGATVEANDGHHTASVPVTGKVGETREVKEVKEDDDKEMRADAGKVHND